MQVKKVGIRNGETIAYRERDGGDEVILLIHGNMTSSKHWDLLIDVLNPKYKVYAVDLRGFGFSSYHEKITSIKDFSDDLKMFVDRIGIKKFSLIGWSTGGAVSMQFAIDYPEQVEKIVLLASASTRGYPIFAMEEDGTIDVTKRLVTYEEIQSDIRTQMMQGLYDTKNKTELMNVWNSLIYTNKRPDAEKYDEYLDDMLTQRNLAEVYHALNTFNISAEHNGAFKGTGEAKAIRVPVLNLYGENDLVVTRQMTDEITEDLAHSVKTVEMKQCGHSLFIDNLPRLQHEIESFLD